MNKKQQKKFNKYFEEKLADIVPEPWLKDSLLNPDPDKCLIELGLSEVKELHDILQEFKENYHLSESADKLVNELIAVYGHRPTKPEVKAFGEYVVWEDATWMKEDDFEHSNEPWLAFGSYSPIALLIDFIGFESARKVIAEIMAE